LFDKISKIKIHKLFLTKQVMICLKYKKKHNLLKKFLLRMNRHF